MGWFKRHLNWTLISVWLGGGLLLVILLGLLVNVPNPTDLASSLRAYHDEACSRRVYLTERLDLQWTETEQEGWQEAIWLVYLKNEGNVTIEVRASSTEDPRLAVPGWSVSSETIRLKPGESKPLSIKLLCNPFFAVSGSVYYQIVAVDESTTFWPFLSYGLWIAVVYYTAGWVLRQKGRSLWWLALLGFGIIIALCLEKRK